LTIYISTPTANMTLARQYHELAELDARLRNQIPSRLPLKLPFVTPPIVKKRNVLATISRTLSPRRSPTFESGLATKGVAPKPIESTTLDLVELNSYLNGLAADTIVREHPAFKHFVTTRADDLESERVERCIKRTRSDLTTHLTPSRDASTDRDVMSTSEDSVSDVVDTSAATHLSLPPIHEITASPEKTKGRRELSSATDLTTASSEMDTSSRPSTVELGEGTKEMEGSKVSDARTRSVSKQSVMMTVDSFEILRVLGKGCAGMFLAWISRCEAGLTNGYRLGKVLLVRQRETLELFALKAITKQHVSPVVVLPRTVADDSIQVLAHRELDHTRTEQSVLKRCSRDHTNPFVVKLHASFHDSETLYLALEFHPGGDLATQLARWGRLGRDRARFYTAEIVEGVEGLHRAGVIYRDLKPENILISQEGHVVLTDFGLSKDFEHARIAAGGKGDLGWVSSRSVSAPVSWMASRRETTCEYSS
jgi:serum/glucocorticoid-regulated kinase 2